MNKILYLLILFSVIYTLSSCKKDDEERQSPTITIISPGSGQSFSVFDTINVVAQISHDREVSKVTISLLNKNNNPEIQPVILNTSGSDFTVEKKIHIYNDRMESGSYDLAVRATDNEKQSTAYQNINIIGVPLEFLELIVITQFNTLKSTVYALSNNLEKTTLFGISRGYAGSDISSREQQLYFASPEPSKLLAFDLDMDEQAWEYSALPPYAYFYDVLYDQGLVYLASGNSNILGLSSSGTNQYVTPTIPERYPEKIFRHEGYIVSDQAKRNEPERVLTLNYTQTGVLARETITSLEIVEFFSLSQDEILLFANSQEGGGIYIYSIEDNRVSEPLKLLGEEIDHVISADTNRYLVAMNSAVYQYNSTNNVFSLFLPVSGLKKLALEKLQNLLFVAINQQVRLFTYPDGGFVNLVDMESPVLNIHLHYNR